MDVLTGFKQSLAFPLDDFQEEAIERIDEGNSVVVCAPTGSGKTVIAEFAATKAIGEGRKLFYTTPLKALSNQKYHDLKQLFGEAFVGLLTGDTSANREARIVVMTTEVFRNMLYGLNEDRTLLNNLGYVVLDECHFMNDADRGTVWEESIIYCPEHVQIIALSATVANAEELTQWIDHTHHNCDLIWSDFRPVPLHFYYYARKSLLPLFEGNSKRLNKRLKLLKSAGPVKGRPGGQKNTGFDVLHLVDTMAERDMLPAIVFTFSRKGCDQSMRTCLPLDLTSSQEKEGIRATIEQIRQTTNLELDAVMEECLLKGLASHHAGLLPATKLLVETLFQRNLIKVVFATETLAAGINMPARTTVITSISKRTDVGHRTLTASEFLQMSGRAGRRGMDPLGNVIVVHSPFHDAAEAGKLAASEADPLNSRFTPTYGMVLNLLQKFTLQQAGYLVSKSFGAFTMERRTRPLMTELDERKQLLDEAVHFPCPHQLTLQQFQAHLNDRAKMTLINKRQGIFIRQQKKHGAHPEVQAQIDALEAEKETLAATLDTHVCSSCELFRKHRRMEERVGRLNRQVTRLESQYEDEKNIYWQQFLNLTALLKDVAFLTDQDKPTPSGVLASKIRAENEVYLATAILDGYFDNLEPEALAAVVSAVVNDSNRENVFSQLRYSREVRKTLDRLGRLMHRLDQLQKSHSVQVPMHLNSSASALVEAWARGTSWQGLMALTSMDAGDLVRNIRRTADVLRQMSKIPEMPPALAYAAHMALMNLYRDPVREVDIKDDDLKPKTLADFEQAAVAPEQG